MLFGRDDIIDSIANQSLRRQVLTIVGPAGVGKSCVASAIAERTAARYPDGSVRVDLAPLDDEHLLDVVLASSLGVSPASSEPRGSLLAYLSSKEMLLLIDNGEHVVGSLAYITEEIARNAPKVDILVTSREPMRCNGEWLYRLPPLPVPSERQPLSIEQAMQSPSVLLFAQCAARSLSGFRLTETNTPTIVGICRELDGIPLAIQLVAARVRNFSIEELAHAVSRRPLLLTSGWRSTNVSHHGSLQAALDWTYTRLTAEEQLVFRRLGVFPGAFSLPSAMDVAGMTIFERVQLPEILLSLVDKSLISLQMDMPQAPYRLLRVTRSYVLEKLIADGEHPTLLRRHAAHFTRVMRASAHKEVSMSHEEWLSRYQYALDDIRAALEWAFSERGDPTTGAWLAVASLPVMYQLCRAREFQSWANRSLRVLAASEPDSLIPQVSLGLALGALYINAGCEEESALFESVQRAVELSDRTGDVLLQATARLNQIICHLLAGNPTLAVERLAALGELATQSDEPIVEVIFDRVSAQAHHFNGEFSRSRTFAQRTLHGSRHPINAPIIYSAQALDHRVSMRVVLARTAWLEGRADEAAQIVLECVNLARQEGPIALAPVLGLCACPVSFWRGDLEAARAFTDELTQCSKLVGLSSSLEFARCYRVALGTLREEDPNFLGPVHPANLLQVDHLCTVSDQWLNGTTLSRADQGLTGWCTAEVLRRHGEVLLQKPDSEQFPDAERLFRRALAVARSQGAHAWEVRACMSLVRLHRHGPQYQSTLQDLEIAFHSLKGGAFDHDAIQAASLLS